MKALPQHYLQALNFVLMATEDRELFLDSLHVFVSHSREQEGQMYLEIYEKRPGGVAHANGWMMKDRDEIHEFLLNLGLSGLTRVSPRPYRLGQACDGTIGASVLHAFKVACDALGLDAGELHRRAYDDEKVPNWIECQLHAEWQGGRRMGRELGCASDRGLGGVAVGNQLPLLAGGVRAGGRAADDSACA